MAQGNFEAKNYALRKSKDGVIVSFVVHPNDVEAAMTALPIGARVMIGWAEIEDKEPPAPEPETEDEIEYPF